MEQQERKDIWQNKTQYKVAGDKRGSDVDSHHVDSLPQSDDSESVTGYLHNEWMASLTASELSEPITMYVQIPIASCWPLKNCPF